MADLGSYLEIPALGGESFALGRLYDCRRQKVLLGKNLWDKKTIEDHTITTENFNTDFKIDVSNSLSDRANLFNVDGSVKLGILTGLIPLGGTGYYLSKGNSTKKSSSISLFLKMVTRTERLSDDITKVFGNQEIGDGTHVIVEITYGARAVFDFKLDNSKESKTSKIGGKISFGQDKRDENITGEELEDGNEKSREKSTHQDLVEENEKNIDKDFKEGKEKSPAIQKEEDSSEIFNFFKQAIGQITSPSISANLKGRKNSLEKNMIKNMQCTFKGDTYIESVPKTFKDAEKLYTELPNIIKENKQAAVPLFVKMIPLSQLNNKLKKVYKEIRDVRIQQISEIFDESEEIKVRLNDVLNSVTFTHFPELKKEYEKLQKYFAMGLNWFKMELCQVLPDIRDGKKHEKDLSILIDRWNKSPFSSIKSEKFLTNLEEYFRVLDALCHILFENHNAANLKQVPPKQETTISLVLYCQGKTDNFLLDLENYLDKHEVKEKYSPFPQFTDVRNANKIAADFKNFALANRHSKNTLSVHTYKRCLDFDVDIKLFEGGQESKISLPLEVKKIEVENITQVSFDLMWVDDLNGDDILHYKISITENEASKPIQTKEEKAKKVRITNLKPGNDYHIIISACSKIGLSKELSITASTTAFIDSSAITNFFLHIVIDDIEGLQGLTEVCNELNQLKEKLVECNGTEELTTHEMITNPYFKQFLQKWTSLYSKTSCHVQEIAKHRMKKLLSPFSMNYYPITIDELKVVLEIIEPISYKEDTNQEGVKTYQMTQSEMPKNLDNQTVPINFTKNCCEESNNSNSNIEKTFTDSVQEFKPQVNQLDQENMIVFSNDLTENEDFTFDSDSITPVHKSSPQRIISQQDSVYFTKMIDKEDIPTKNNHENPNKTNYFKDNPEDQTNNTEKKISLNTDIKYQSIMNQQDQVDIINMSANHSIPIGNVNNNLQHKSTKNYGIKDPLKSTLNHDEKSNAKIDQQHFLGIEKMSECQTITVEKTLNNSHMKSNNQLLLNKNQPSIAYIPSKIITQNDISSIKIRKQMLNAQNWEDFQNLFLQKVYSHDQLARKLKFPPNSPYKSYSDLLISVMERCDEFVLQTLFEKLLDNQFSIPVLCQINRQKTFFLWPLRTIKKSWIINKKQNMEKFISKHRMKTISFCRAGPLKEFSKSIIINTLLSSCQGWDDHMFFLNKKKESRSHLNRGSVEACFFCPDARDGEKFTDIHCIYNLRGDALDFPNEFRFLLEVSSTLVIFSEHQLSCQTKQNLFIESSDNVIYVVLDQNLASGMVEVDNIKTMHAGDMVEEEFCDELASILSTNLGHKFLSIEEQSEEAKKMGFFIDEEKMECKNGTDQAKTFMEKIGHFINNERKENVVKLQGKHWKDWAMWDKEEVRLKWVQDKNPEEYQESIISSKEKSREGQRNTKVSDAMVFFIEQIKYPKNEYTLKYFLEWCQIFLNCASQEQIFQLQQKYKMIKEQAKNEGFGNPLESDLDRISDQLFQLSFGLEHIFRELGQLYECNFSNHEYKVLPKCMANLMMLGFSLEIMDGDVSHVPATWVNEVLKYLDLELKKPRVLVLSVLGIQSCGKSTLLNEMFGCKFPVSAGRCTKGVFIQLVPVEKELSKKMNCDYFLIMDAEGLRSPNLSGEFCHDNEIATFVTFLSDLTLVTFQGDTLSTEMRDILEIVFHAYARMKEIDLKSFVHLTYLRVSGLNSEEKNLGIEQNVIKELDNMAKEIASIENRSDLTGGFSSIFQPLKEHFPGLKFEQTLPNLWTGNMKVPESRFGQLAGGLRDSICEALKYSDEKPFAANTLENFTILLQSTWKAIKAENFVLNFKNIKQINSYKKLEKEYYKLKDEVWQKFLCQSCLVTQTKELWLTFGSEQKAYENFTKSLYVKVNLEEDCKNVANKLTETTHTLEDPDFASKYHRGFMEDLNISIQNWTHKKKQDIEKKIYLAFVEKNLPSSNYYNLHLKTETRHLAELLRKKEEKDFTEKKINEEFEIWFKEEFSKAEKKDKDNITVDAFDEVQNSTIQILEEELKVLQVPEKTFAHAHKRLKLIKDNKINDLVGLLKSKHKKYLQKKGKSKKELSEPTMILIQAKWEVAIKNVLKLLETETTNNFEHLSYPEIIKKVISKGKEEIHNFEEQNFVLTKEFEWYVIVYLFGISVRNIANIYEEYLKKVSHVQNLTNMKESLRCDFIKDCTTANQSLRMGEKFADAILKDAVVFHIQVSKGREIGDYFREQPCLSTKSEFTFKMLEELLDADTEKILFFLQNYKSYAEDWISEKAQKSCETDDYLAKWLKRQIEKCISKIIDKLNKTATKAEESGMMLGTWFEALASSLMDEKDDTKKIDLKVSKEDFFNLAGSEAEISTFIGETIHLISKQEFQDQIFKAILEKSNEPYRSTEEIETPLDFLINLFKHIERIVKPQWIKILNWLEFRPLDCLKDQLLGCTDQCPLCGAICEGGVACKNEKTRSQAHFTEIHLPSGIKGWVHNHTHRLTSGICSVEMCGEKQFLLTPALRERFLIKHEKPIPFKEANNVFKGIWRIRPDPSSDATRFWKFLFVNHHKKIAEIVKAKKADDIPPSWHNITREQALENLKDVKNQI